jgi:CheY-like chemotaxis protein
MTTIQAAVIDDEEPMLELAKALLEIDGDVQVDAFEVVWDAFSALSHRSYDVVVCDYQMPEMDGLQVLRTLRENGSHVPFILFTGKGREEVAIEALNLGADRYIQKGGDPKAQFVELKHAVVQLHQRVQTESELLESKRELEVLYRATEELVGDHDLREISQTIFKAIPLAMQTDAMMLTSYDQKTNSIYTEAAWSNGKMLDATRFPPVGLDHEGHGTQSQVIRSGKPLIIPDYQALIKATAFDVHLDDEGKAQKPAREITDQARSAILVPLRREDQVIGVLSVISDYKGAFSEGHLRFLEPLAGSAAAAISLSRMHQEEALELDRRGLAEHQRQLMEAMIEASEEGIMVWHLGRGTEEYHPVIWNRASASLLLGKEEGSFSTLKDCSQGLSQDLDALAREVGRTSNQVKVLVVREGAPDRQLMEVSITPLDSEHVGFIVAPK